jgi:hypothetical protein
MQSCWAEVPQMRPNFKEVVCMLNSFLSSISTPQRDPEIIQKEMVSKSMPSSRKIDSKDASSSKEKEAIIGANSLSAPQSKPKGVLSTILKRCRITGTGERILS